jgi:phage/plasmid-like protein (TIGR03299 family)
MSSETLQWLNDNTLIGYTDDLGDAWHHDGIADNHYPGAIPLDDINHLFGWSVVECPITVDLADIDGSVINADGHKALVHPDNQTIFSIVSTRYEVHQYNEWLVEQVQSILDVSDGDLTIGSAGLLKMGAQAWVQVRPPSTINVGGEDQLPWILATTSHDRTLATQYKGQRQRVVCDNTLAIGLHERTSEFRVKHTANSRARLGEARQALELIYTQQDDFNRDVEQLMNTGFNTAMFRDLNNQLYPEIEPNVEDGKITNQRAINNRDRTIEQLEDMWLSDERVAPVAGTVWGAMQAHNTWFHWHRTHGTGGDETLMKARQIQSNINGDTDVYDRRVKSTIDTMLAAI